MKWQPIETAPTDGTRILLRGRNGRIADGHYGQPDGFANPKRFVWPYINATPTHWAPLALIAAAAELLAAAIRVNALSIQTNAHKELRAAIANATGDDDAAPECTRATACDIERHGPRRCPSARSIARTSASVIVRSRSCRGGACDARGR